MNSKALIAILLVIATLFTTVLSAGCIEKKPNMLGSQLLCGFTVKLKVRIHVGIGPVTTTNDQGIMFSSEVKYRKYNVSVSLDASTIGGGGNAAGSSVTPVAQAPDETIYPCGNTAVSFINTVGQWAGQMFNKDGAPTITVTTNDSNESTQIEKPGKYITILGQQLIDWEGLKEDAIQVASSFSFNIFQKGQLKTPQPIIIPFLITLPAIALDAVPDTLVEIEFYCPFGGRFIKDDYSFSCNKTSATYEMGWKTEYWNDPISGLLNKLVSWATDGNYDYFFEPVNRLFGTNFPRDLLRIDYSVAPYYHKSGDDLSLKDKIVNVPKSFFGFSS